MLAPPEQAILPAVRIDQGVVDGKLLDLAGWASARRACEIRVNGGTVTQRRAVADGIVSRGGRATTGTEPGKIRLSWEALEIIVPDLRQHNPVRPDGLRP